MNPGEFRDRVEVYSTTGVNGDEYAVDEIGGLQDAEVLKGVIWARVRTPALRDGVLAMQEAEIRTHEVTCRGGDKAPVAGDILVWLGTRLKVRGTRPDPKTRLVIADCVGDKP